MSYDKIVDSAKLDAAMNATADAIRGKTGGSADIPWNESTGFASAIAAIASGTSGGSQVVTGTFLRTDYDVGTPHEPYQWTIAGLGFKPSTVIIFAEPEDGSPFDLIGSVTFAVRLGDYTWFRRVEESEREQEDEDGEIYSYTEYRVDDFGYNHATGKPTNVSYVYGMILPSDDGFVFRTNINLRLAYDRPYRYIAIG